MNNEVADKMINVITYDIEHIGDGNPIVLDFLKLNDIEHRPIGKLPSICYTIYRYESYMLDPITQFSECFLNDLIHYSNVPEADIINNYL
jgi:hypothetical protein